MFVYTCGESYERQEIAGEVEDKKPFERTEELEGERSTRGKSSGSVEVLKLE